MTWKGAFHYGLDLVFRQMKVLNLHSNKLDGHIPIELRGVASLQIVDVADNNLSTSMP